MIKSGGSEVSHIYIYMTTTLTTWLLLSPASGASRRGGSQVEVEWFIHISELWMMQDIFGLSRETSGSSKIL